MLTFIINLLIIIIFVIIGGVFACTELGLLSLRDTQIDKLEKESEYGEKLAQVVREPNQFLSTVQIGVTLAGMFSASFGTAKLAPIAAEKLSLIGVPVKVGETLSVIILTIFVAYLSLILGELVPKRIAMQKTEQVVRVTGHIVLFLIRFSKPVVYVLSVSTNAVLKLLRLKPDQASDEIDAQEAREIIAGLDELSEGEKEILDDVFSAKSTTVGTIMTPRGDVEFIDASLTISEATALIQKLPFSRYPVIGDDFDDIIGFIHIRDLYAPGVRSNTRIKTICREALLLPNTNLILKSIHKMRDGGFQMAIVVDEYGGTDGIVTLEDMVEEIIGDINDEYDISQGSEIKNLHNGISIDAGLPIEDAEELTDIKFPDGQFETVAGFILSDIGTLAKVGDLVKLKSDDKNILFKVTQIDGHKIERVMITEV